MATYLTAPTNLDQYSRNFMQVFDEASIVGVPTLFQAFFAKGNSKTLFSPDANDVDIDIMRMNEKTAALVPRGTITQKIGSTQQDTTSQRYSTFSRSFPLIEEEGSVNANQLLNRVAGETPYQRNTRLVRQRILLGREHAEQVRRTIRACERLAAQSILTGKMDAIFGTTDTALQYDFKRKSTHTVPIAESWFTADHDIVGDIFSAWKLGRIDAHVSMGAGLFGENTMSAFIQSSQIKTLADNRRFQLIEAGNIPVPTEYQWMLDSGALARGRLQLPEGPTIWLFTYLDGYTNNAGTFVNYMPINDALFFWNGAEVHRYFGPPERLPLDAQEKAWYREMFGFNMDAPPMPPNIKGTNSVVSPAMMYFDAYKSADKKSVVPRLQAAPIFAPVQTDAYVTLTGPGTPL